MGMTGFWKFPPKGWWADVGEPVLFTTAATRAVARSGIVGNMTASGDVPVVRRAQRTDVNDLRRMSVVFTPYAELLDDEEFRRRCGELMVDDAWFLAVAEAGGGVVGYVAAQDFGPGLRASFTTGRIHDLFVDHATRRRGVGRLLMNSVIDWAHQRPHPMILDWQGTTGGVDFYETLGFTADRVGDHAEFPAFSLDLREPGS